MATIELAGATSRTRGRWALRDVRLAVADGELLAVVGPSGAGKTTLLRLVAGLEDLAGGDLLIDGVSVTGVPTSSRDLAMVVQDAALLPHLDVRRNLAFPLRLRRMPPAEVAARVEAGAQVLGIRQLLDRRPDTLSAGEQQMGAIGRVTVRRPSAYLMDEPLAALDPRERDRVRTELRRYVDDARVTTLYATNDQREAMALADRIAVLRDGCLVEVGAPGELYARPRSVFTAAFLGEPGMVLLRGRLEAGGRRAFVRVGVADIEIGPLPDALRRAWDAREVIAGLRAEHLTLATGNGGTPATVEAVEVLGATNLVHVSLDGAPAESPRVAVRVEPSTRPGRGTPVRVLATPARVHLFDPDDERSFWHGQT